MATICITGAVQDDLERVGNIFEAAGMESHKPAMENVNLDIITWHDRVVAAARQISDAPGQIITPGRIWENMAVEIFQANISSPIWGWTAQHSVMLLNFWHDFDPEIYFLLLCLSPEQMVARTLEIDLNPTSIPAAVDTWLIYHEQLLRFYQRHQERSLLINFDEFNKGPSQLITYCNLRWGLSLNDTQQSVAPEDSLNQFTLYLARQLCQKYPSSISLAYEIDASALRLMKNDGRDKQLEALTDDLLFEFVKLHDRSNELAQIRNAKLQILNLIKERDEQTNLAIVRQAQLEELTNEFCNLNRQVEVLKNTNALTKESDSIIKNLTSENELLIIQINKLQDELKSRLFQQHSSSQQIEILAQENSKLLQERNNAMTQSNSLTQTLEEQQKRSNDQEKQLQLAIKTQEEQSKLAVERQAQLEKSNKYYLELSHKVETLLEENSKLQQQHGKLTTQSNSLTQYLEEQQKLFNDQEKKLQLTIKFKEEQSKLALECQAQLIKINNDYNELSHRFDALQKTKMQLKDAEVKIHNITKENDLLLLQLHHVQQELESYFLKYQNTIQQLEELETRRQHILQANPYYYDFDSITITPIEKTAPPFLHCQFQKLAISGRCFVELEIDVVLEDGIAGLCFRRHQDGSLPLLSAPSTAYNQNAVVFLPIFESKNAQSRFELFRDITTSDWHMLQSLAELLYNALHSPSMTNAVKQSIRDLFISGLHKFITIIVNFPPLIHYDQVELIREVVNSSYEHLWLRLTKLIFGEKRWPDFEFRISSSHNCSDNFGSYPKIEFPKVVGQSSLEAWFEESSDDFGPKLELRFALPSDIDLNAWQHLSYNDKYFILSLVDRLPSILNRVQNSDVNISRPWSDWNLVAHEINRILTMHTHSIQ